MTTRPPDKPADPPQDPSNEGNPEEKDQQLTEEVFALGARIDSGFTEEMKLPDTSEPGTDEFVPELDPELRDALAEGETGEFDSGETDEHESGDLDDPEQTETFEVVAVEPTAVVAVAGGPAFPSSPPITGDHEPPPRRPRLFLRFFAASLIIIVSFAAATSASVLVFLSDIVGGFGPEIEISRQILPAPDPGKPQTLLILGSDKRANISSGEELGLADTVMLVRVDPDTNLISMLSIPRDLKVDIPGYGVDKFNAAYSIGGAKLTVETLNAIGGPRLHINHVFNTDFLGFIETVDEVGCVFVNVDRRYYHSNEGVPASEQYDEIDIRPGYQKLCGEDALSFVRYRHTDTDLARAARQQEFLEQTRNQVPLSTLLTDPGGLIHAVTSNTSSDIGKSDGAEFRDLLNLVVDARSSHFNEIEFPATLSSPTDGGPSYVLATEPEIHQAIRELLGVSSLPNADAQTPGGGVGEPVNASERKQQLRARQKAPRTAAPKDDGLVDDPDAGETAARRIARHTGPSLPIYYPTRLPESSAFATRRAYHLRDQDKKTHAAYVMVLQLAEGGYLVEDYVNFQGVRGWEDPSILAAEHSDIKIGETTFSVYPDGDRVSMVSWTADGNSYWINNTLVNTLTRDQMLGMARSLGIKVPNPKKQKKSK